MYFNNRKKTRYFSLFLIIFAFPIFADTTAAMKLTELLNQFTSLKAHFTEKTLDSQQNLVQKSEGEMMLLRPNCFFWQTEKPMHQLVVTNGKTLWIYDRGLEQATQEPISSIPVNPAKILSGNAYDLMKQFDVRMIPHTGITVFQLTPIAPNPGFQYIAIAFSHGKLSSMHIATSLNQVSMFDFSDVKMNPHLNPALFHFVPPKNTEVLQ